MKDKCPECGKIVDETQFALGHPRGICSDCAYEEHMLNEAQKVKT